MLRALDNPIEYRKVATLECIINPTPDDILRCLQSIRLVRSVVLFDGTIEVVPPAYSETPCTLSRVLKTPPLGCWVFSGPGHQHGAEGLQFSGMGTEVRIAGEKIALASIGVAIPRRKSTTSLDIKTLNRKRLDPLWTEVKGVLREAATGGVSCVVSEDTYFPENHLTMGSPGKVGQLIPPEVDPHEAVEQLGRMMANAAPGDFEWNLPSAPVRIQRCAGLMEPTFVKSLLEEAGCQAAVVLADAAAMGEASSLYVTSDMLIVARFR
ncbi:MAG: uncharacterized protein KVP18_003826 [Porospora cf. gigantea A]|uniref:uncharacterized protein n=1 Tax=Porospora cf. gigantea A TaxID=2853593 RepID=UPI003559B02B|nr:MAG: hypothetical protein KVP18_003826 [Porospora cf. gigantea A]